VPAQSSRPQSLAEAARHLIARHALVGEAEESAHVAAQAAQEARVKPEPPAVVMAYEVLAREADKAIVEARANVAAAVETFNEMLQRENG
jgi:regulator of sirC expression with transglutaminase-like and TPR domain